MNDKIMLKEFKEIYKNSIGTLPSNEGVYHLAREHNLGEKVGKHWSFSKSKLESYLLTRKLGRNKKFIIEEFLID